MTKMCCNFSPLLITNDWNKIAAAIRAEALSRKIEDLVIIIRQKKLN